MTIIDVVRKGSYGGKMDSHINDELALLDKYLSPTVRRNIEIACYEKINQNAQLSHIIADPVFLAHPLSHISFSPDHGVVHVRDIAARVLKLLDDLQGVHFPARSASRLDFMKGYGAMLAYIHDVGMMNVKSVEQDMYAQASAHAVFNDFFDHQLSLLWEENSGNVAWRITQLAFKKAITQPPHLVLREMLALAGAHRADVIPVDLLNHPAELRRAMQDLLGYSLAYQWRDYQVRQLDKQLKTAQSRDPILYAKLIQQKADVEKQEISAELNKFLAIYYADFKQDSFQWLISDNKEVRDFVDDIVDTVRVLRCANAGRLRGERLRAMGGYQIFLDHRTANAIYAVNVGEQLFLMEAKNTLLAGETNLSSTEFTRTGDLRISFYRGNFAGEEAVNRAVFNAAVAINAIQQDMIESFARPPAGDNNASPDYSKKWKPVYIFLENSDDSDSFATRVKEQIILLNPALKEIIKIAPSLKNVSESERDRYLSAEELNWSLKNQTELLEKVSRSGHKITEIKPEWAFNHVKSADVKAGDVLVQGGTLASFVYIPLSEGLMGYPLGGYEPFSAHAFIPVGNVGVIRGDARNATIVAEKAVKVLMIPREIYLNYWHCTYDEDEFIQMVKMIKV